MCEGGGGGQRPQADSLRLQRHQERGGNPVRLRRAGQGDPDCQPLALYSNRLSVEC